MKAFLDIFRDLDNAQTEEQKIEILRANKSPALMDILRYGMHPNGGLYTSEVPPYKDENTPDGLAFSNLYAEVKRLYAIHKDYNLPAKRKEEILIQMLESLGTEAPILEQIITRKFKSINREIVDRAFPGLIERTENRIAV
jgi:hypothetical protein